MDVSGSHPIKFKLNYNDVTFTGTCAQLGLQEPADGSTVTIDGDISNTSKIAKIVYYYVYEKNLYDKDKKASAILGSGANYSENAAQVIEFLVQRYNMGWSDFWAARTDVNGYATVSNPEILKDVAELYNNFDTSKVTVPSTFAMIHVKSGNNRQDGILWTNSIKITKLKLKKQSSNTSITG